MRLTGRAAVVLFLAAGALAVMIAAQSKPLEQRQFPAIREIGAYYFNSMNESQVWVNVEPAHLEGGAEPIIFNVTVKFTGLRLDREPETVELRPQVRCLPPVYPMRPRIPVFRLTIDSRPKIDLSPDGKTSFFLASCGAGPDSVATFDTVGTQVPFAMLRTIAAAESVTMDAIGFSVKLKPEDSEALRAFVRTVEHGVILQK